MASSLPPHPGTKVGRERAAWNPQIAPAEFERRFLATRARLEEHRWDFVIVGAGSAGCVLAARLAQDPKVRVLMLEAGGEMQNAARVRDPRCAWGLVGSEADWGFRSTGQPQLLPEGRVVDLERGKGLGGSSCLNYSMWVRGAPQDFDRWSREFGCGEEWSYAGVLPHFKAIERMLPGEQLPGRGDAGELSPRPLWPPLPEVEALKESFRQNGFEPNGDYNGPDGQAGYGDTQHSVDTSRMRADAFNTFVEPVLRSRPNLCVASEAYTRRLLFEGTRCTGVEVQLNDGSLVAVPAALEVVLSAGALQSPQLLLLSGVGDAQALGKLGIPVVADIPAVGRHLQDHPVLAIPWQAPEGMKVEFAEGGGPAGTTGLNGIAFWKSEVDKGRDAKRGSDSGCDMEVIFVSRMEAGVMVKAFVSQWDNRLGGRLKSGALPWTEKAFVRLGRFLSGVQPVRELLASTMYLATEYNHPLSRGSVTLQSADPLVPPLVDPGWLRDPSDLDAAVEALRKMLELMQTAPFSEYLGNMDAIPGIHGFWQKGFQPLFDASDAQLRDIARRFVGTTWHYSCTVRMGAPDAPLTEVALDPQLHVRGISGLRVADQSVTPFVVSANTNASSMMIGDKAAKRIMQDHGLGPFREARSAL